MWLLLAEIKPKGGREALLSHVFPLKLLTFGVLWMLEHWFNKAFAVILSD